MITNYGHVIQIGKSVENRELWVMDISDNIEMDIPSKIYLIIYIYIYISV